MRAAARRAHPRPVTNTPTPIPGGLIMVRYFYAWTPLVIVGTIFVLSAPWLGLIALMLVVLVALVALAALAWAVVALPSLLIRAGRRRRHGRSGANQPRPPLAEPARALGGAPFPGDRWSEAVEVVSARPPLGARARRRSAHGGARRA
jgi:hypothetical protein